MLANPVLNMRDRSMIGQRFIGNLLSFDEHAKRHGYNRLCTVTNTWQNLGAFNFNIVSPIVVNYFSDIGYISRYNNGMVRVSDQARELACTQPEHYSFTIPRGYTDQLT